VAAPPSDYTPQGGVVSKSSGLSSDLKRHEPDNNPENPAAPRHWAAIRRTNADQSERVTVLLRPSRRLLLLRPRHHELRRRRALESTERHPGQIRFVVRQFPTVRRCRLIWREVDFIGLVFETWSPDMSKREPGDLIYTVFASASVIAFITFMIFIRWGRRGLTEIQLTGFARATGKICSSKGG
jgi:hypothetical protein